MIQVKAAEAVPGAGWCPFCSGARFAMSAESSIDYQVYPFDARGIARRFRHAAIFGALDALQPGEAMRFVNDHDPLPLLAQVQGRYGDAVEILYRQREAGAVVIDFVVGVGEAEVGGAEAGSGCGCGSQGCG